MSINILGIDTSNYRTSLALISDDGKILLNIRELLPVPAGERGLRQNEAVFAHLRQLSASADLLRQVSCDPVAAVAASTAPRDGNESYMPQWESLLSERHISAAILPLRKPVQRWMIRMSILQSIFRAEQRTCWMCGRKQ